MDRLSALLHVSEPSGLAHLAAEGIPGGRVHRAGNVMADAVRLFLPRARALDVARTAGRRPRSFGVVTLHRPANVDDPARLARFACALGDLARELPLVFPVHPRTQRTLGAAQRRRLARAGVRLMPPLGYLAFLSLLDASALALTDSGGVPVEASLLRVPCVTLRARYEHVLTLTHGTNRLAGGDPRRLVAAARAALGAPRVTHALPEAWDGRAAPRIVARWTAEAPPGST